MKVTALFAIFGLLLAALPAAAAPPARQHILLDAGWRFHQEAPMVLRKATPLTDWSWRPAAPGEDPALVSVGREWKQSKTGEDTFGGRVGFAVYQAALPYLSGPGRTLHFGGVDDNATVYVNGKKLATHSGWNDPFDVLIDAAWIDTRPNIVTVLVENTAGAGGITGGVTLGLAPVAAAGGADPSRPGFNDRAWRVVHLPHDYVVEGAFNPLGDASHGSLIPAPAWYRKTFTLPASDKGKSLWIDFDGAYRDSTVYLNGKKLGTHPCGYTPFRFDISGAAKYGAANVLAVHVNPQKFEGWWYEGGGIYRHVWLNKAAPVHVAPWGVFVTSKLPEPVPGQPVAPAVVTVKTTVDYPAVYDSNGLAPRLVSQVRDPAGTVVGTATVPLTVAAKTITQAVTVAKPALWSVETPRMYTLHTEIRRGSELIDMQDTPFGIRTIRFDANKGFFLNGKSVKVKGTCNHQDFAGVGVALPDSLLTWRVKQLQKMGSNAYRTAHNPPTKELLDACDKLGMLVMDENRHLGDTEDGKASPSTPYADLSEVESMVLRDRNHPSVIMWSMCNEEPIQNSEAGARIFSAMKKVVDAADGTRPVTCAMNSGEYAGIALVEDLRGFNYGPGAYAPYHAGHPASILYGSETSSEVGTRGVYGPDTFKSGGVTYLGDEAKGWVSAYDIHAPGWAQTAEVAWAAIADKPYVFGGFVWTGFDYKGEPTPFGWPDVNSNFGILDQCGFPKDAYYYYQSVWGDKPMVHLLPHWNWAGKEGQPIDVWAYSNAARVELLLNGVSLGAKEMPKNSHLSWSVPYAPGTLSARAYDAAGTLMAQDRVETTGAPTALSLSTDRTTLTADGEDLTLIEVDVRDAQGRIVPTAGNLVSFTLTGPGRIAGVGNGNPSSHEPDQASSRSAFNGKCLVIVGASDAPGDLLLTARAPGLKPATLRLSIKK